MTLTSKLYSVLVTLLDCSSFTEVPIDFVRHIRVIVELVIMTRFVLPSQQEGSRAKASRAGNDCGAIKHPGIYRNGKRREMALRYTVALAMASPVTVDKPMAEAN